MRKTVRVNFAGAGWDNATPEDYPFKDILEQHFAVEISPEPDYLIQKESADLYHGLLLRYPSANVRLYCPGEALAPDFNLFDYSFGFDPLAYGDRYLQWDILHLFRDDVLADWPLDQPRAFARQPERFCNFCYSNAQANPLRDQFYEFLSQHEPVESIGRHLRNTTREEDPALGWRENKIKLLADYRFTIAFENACFPGYTTEKLIHPLLAGSIPIYWGNPRVGEIFNEKAFINCHNFDGFEEVLATVRTLAGNPERLEAMRREPIVTPAQLAVSQAFPAKEAAFVRHIFEQDLADARRRGDGFWNSIYEKTLIERTWRASKPLPLHERALAKVQRTLNGRSR